MSTSILSTPGEFVLPQSSQKALCFQVGDGWLLYTCTTYLTPKPATRVTSRSQTVLLQGKVIPSVAALKNLLFMKDYPKKVNPSKTHVSLFCALELALFPSDQRSQTHTQPTEETRNHQKKRIVVMGKPHDEKHKKQYPPTQGYRKTPLANVSFVHGGLSLLYPCVALVYKNGKPSQHYSSQ